MGVQPSPILFLTFFCAAIYSLFPPSLVGASGEPHANGYNLRSPISIIGMQASFSPSQAQSPPDSLIRPSTWTERVTVDSTSVQIVLSSPRPTGVDSVLRRPDVRVVLASSGGQLTRLPVESTDSRTWVARDSSLESQLRGAGNRLLLSWNGAGLSGDDTYYLPNPFAAVRSSSSSEASPSRSEWSLWTWGVLGGVLVVLGALATWWLFISSGAGPPSIVLPSDRYAPPEQSTPRTRFRSSALSSVQPDFSWRLLKGDSRTSVEKLQGVLSALQRAYPASYDATSPDRLVLYDVLLLPYQVKMATFLLSEVQLHYIPRRLRARLLVFRARPALRSFFADLNLSYSRLSDNAAKTSLALSVLFDCLEQIDRASQGTALSDTPLYDALVRGDAGGFGRQLEKIGLAALVLRQSSALHRLRFDEADVHSEVQSASRSWHQHSVKQWKAWGDVCASAHAEVRRYDDLRIRLETMLDVLQSSAAGTRVLRARAARPQKHAVQADAFDHVSARRAVASLRAAPFVPQFRQQLLRIHVSAHQKAISAQMASTMLCVLTAQTISLLPSRQTQMETVFSGAEIVPRYIFDGTLSARGAFPTHRDVQRFYADAVPFSFRDSIVRDVPRPDTVSPTSFS